MTMQSKEIVTIIMTAFKQRVDEETILKELAPIVLIRRNY